MSNALTIIAGSIEESRSDFSRVLADRSINFDREAGFAIQQLQRNDFTVKIATNNRQSVIDAVVNIGAIGISLNPARKQAYLVPRDGQICLDISYVGLLDIAVASGSILWGQAELVREQDIFKRVGMDKQPIHEFEPFSKNRGEIVGVYVVAKLHNGDYLTTIMDIEEVHSIRDRSEGWKAFLAKKIKSTPWFSDEGEMIKKTVIKRAYKLWPKTDRMDSAMNHLNTTNAEGLSDKADDWEDVDAMIAEAIATTTDADALAYWRENNGRLAKQPQDHAKLKKAVMEHRTALREQAEAQAEDARTIEVPAKEVTPEAAEFVAAMDAAESYAEGQA